jgi:hypothetical protein
MFEYAKFLFFLKNKTLEELSDDEFPLMFFSSKPSFLEN